MNIAHLLSDLAACDVHLTLSGDQLLVNGRNEVLNHNLLQAITEHKNEIVDSLRLRSSFDDDELGKLVGCDGHIWKVAFRAKQIFNAEVVSVCDTKDLQQ